MIVNGRKDETFSWDEGCKVGKLFLGMKESKEEEEGEPSFLGISEKKMTQVS